MSHVIIDRRLNGKGKSSVNRRKFVQRVRGMLKDAIRENIKKANIKDLIGPGAKKVRIPIGDLEQPSFHHDDGGVRDIVLPGNDRYVVGDKLERPPKRGEGDGPGEGAPDGEGHDEFHFHLTKEEFLDLFFENCELPDLLRTNIALLNEEQLKRAGYTITGSPASLNIVRSMRGAKSRKYGLRALKMKKLRELEAQLKQLEQSQQALTAAQADTTAIDLEIAAIREKIAVLHKKLAAIPFIDPMDLRFNHWQRVRLPSVQAVVFRLMDVSGSMGERMKEMAKTFFLLLHLFLEKNYDHIEIRNVAYHSEATECDDQEFFYGQETGGTVASTGLSKVSELIKEHYPTDLWNIYVAHATDGDNFAYDNIEVRRILAEEILPKVQYYAYVHIGSDHPWAKGDPPQDSLWHVFNQFAETRDNVETAMVRHASDVYPVFLKLFQRKAQ